ncbi:MAG: hypothetical protein V4722_00235 [Bacteroidota bacterium]
MTLYEKLLQARSEEDVMDAYTKALALIGYSSGTPDGRAGCCNILGTPFANRAPIRSFS